MKPMNFIAGPRPVAFTLLALLACSVVGAAEQTIDYSRDIKPILAGVCYTCHGPDEEQRKADLRLDTREGALADLDGYAALVPGSRDDSELFVRITSQKKRRRMPPAKTGKTLTPEQIELIGRWIDQGAEFNDHWAYVPAIRPAMPTVRQTSWPRNGVDHFTLARLESEGLSPSPEADRRTLLRRLMFDLVGLPPGPKEIDAFQADKDPDAYERIVDRLLGSQHYGERLAMYWLDVVRFADTNGIHGDNHRDLYLFRDYVIKAFNENKPFDRFTIEQLAGDLLPNATLETKVASGYNRLNMTTREGGAQPKEYLIKYSADRVRNASAAWLGSSMGCAECHDHKYDPFTMRDFYSLAAFFADLKETAVGIQEPTRIPTPKQAAALARFDEKVATLRKTLDTQTPELDAAQADWEQALGEHHSRWTVLQPVEAKSGNGATLEIRTDGTILAKELNPPTDTYTITMKTSLVGITGLRLEVLADESLPSKGPGRAANGNFVLNTLRLTADGTPVPWANVTASHSQPDWNVAGIIDDKTASGWGIIDQTGRDNFAILETEKNLGTGTERSLTVTLDQNYGSQHTLGYFRLAVTTATRPISSDTIPKEIRDVLEIEPDKRTDEQHGSLSAYYRNLSPLLKPVREQLTALQAEREKAQKTIPTTLVSMSIKPRTIRILPRGNWLDETGEIVLPATPAHFPGVESTPKRATRLDLAKWMVQPKNPLVARVFVNRLWKFFFGQGIVTTMEDFGSQGNWPSHPKLLDWLAVEFIESGWDIKHMVKLMVMSNAYRQSSFESQPMRERDPPNRLLARQGRFRLDAELVRDNALAISGLLSFKLGGRSVKPYQPVGYWKHLNFPTRVYEHDHGEDQYRRGLYTYWCRTFLHPSLLAFDAPSREECTVNRPRSNTPLQALVLLNDPIYVEAARVFAVRMLREGGPDASGRIVFAFRQALGRSPSTQEKNPLLSLYEKHHQQYRDDAKAANEILSVGESEVPQGLNHAELAAWTSVARVIFNLHETITRY